MAYMSDEEGQRMQEYQEQQHQQQVSPYQDAYDQDSAGFSANGYGNNLGLSELTHGVSVQGVYNYLENLNVGAFREAKEALRDTGNLFGTFRANWQGKAEENFEKNIASACNIICNGLDSVYRHIYNMLNQLATNMLEQDRQIVQEDENLINFHGGNDSGEA